MCQLPLRLLFMSYGGKMWIEFGVGLAVFLTYLAKRMFDLSAPMFVGLFFLLVIVIFQKM